MRRGSSASAPVSGKVMPILTTLSAAPVGLETATPANTARAPTASILGQPPSLLRCNMMTFSHGLWRATLVARFLYVGPVSRAGLPGASGRRSKSAFALYGWAATTGGATDRE